MRKKIIVGIFAITLCSSAFAQLSIHYHHRHDNSRAILGVLGGIAIASALTPRYYNYPRVIGGVSTFSVHSPIIQSPVIQPHVVHSPMIQPSMVYSTAPVIQPPLVYSSPVINTQLDNCTMSVYNPYMNRNENVIVTCMRNN